MKGYIAISISVILSLVVMVVAIALGSHAFFNRASLSDFDNKQGSFSVARSCLDHALLRYADNTNYAGNETISISNYRCTIRPILTSGSNKIIEARSQINGSTTNLRLIVNASTLSTVSLEEVIKF